MVFTKIRATFRSKTCCAALLAAAAFAANAEAQYVKLTVDSAGGWSNVPIQVSVRDRFGGQNGNTRFERTYNAGTGYTLTAPQQFNNGTRAMKFHHWELRSAPTGGFQKKPLGENVLVVPSIGNLDDVAICHYIIETTVSVRSIGASSVPIELDQADAWGDRNGTTQFFRKFAYGVGRVKFTAPLEHNGKRFYRWHVGSERKTVGARTLFLDIGTDFRTVTAQYGDYLKGEYTLVGSGCTGSNGMQLRQTPRFNPDIGLTVQYRLYEGPQLSSTVMVIGDSVRTWGANRLPLRLPGTSCFVRTNPIVSVPLVTDNTGFTYVRMSIPNDTDLIGAIQYTQFFCIDPGANALNVTTSDAYQTLVGGWKLF